MAQCKYCGLGSLDWVMTPNGWRLFTINAVVHNCRQTLREPKAPKNEIVTTDKTAELVIPKRRLIKV